MGRSHGFGCYYMQLYALFRLAFASTLDHKPFVLLHTVSRWLIMQKARGQAVLADTALPLIVSVWFQVLFHSPLGVLFTFPSRYWFTIGHRVVLSLRRWSSQIHAGFPVSRGTWDHTQEAGAPFVYGAITLYGSACPADSTRRPVCNFPRATHSPDGVSRNPARTTDASLYIRTVWAGSLSLAATNEVAICFLFLGVLRCFSSPGWLPWPMHSARDHAGLPHEVSLFGDPRVRLLPTNRGLSQVATSFIASRCQGIHHTPLIAWPKTLNMSFPLGGKDMRFGLLSITYGAGPFVQPED